jgi:hypothetical protein
MVGHPSDAIVQNIELIADERRVLVAFANSATIRKCAQLLSQLLLFLGIRFEGQSYDCRTQQKQRHFEVGSTITST